MVCMINNEPSMLTEANDLVATWTSHAAVILRCCPQLPFGSHGVAAVVAAKAKPAELVPALSASHVAAACCELDTHRTLGTGPSVLIEPRGNRSCPRLLKFAARQAHVGCPVALAMSAEVILASAALDVITWLVWQKATAGALWAPHKPRHSGEQQLQGLPLKLLHTMLPKHFEQIGLSDAT